MPLARNNDHIQLARFRHGVVYRHTPVKLNLDARVGCKACSYIRNNCRRILASGVVCRQHDLIGDGCCAAHKRTLLFVALPTCTEDYRELAFAQGPRAAQCSREGIGRVRIVDHYIGPFGDHLEGVWFPS